MEQEQWNPTLDETKRALGKVFHKLREDEVISSEQYEVSRDRVDDIAQVMYKINEVDSSLNFVELALACLFRLCGE